MGPSKSGKTSMRSLIFANYLPHDTSRLALTMEIERSHVKFLGNLVLNLWDCGGQYDFIDKYLTNQKDVIFSNVAVMVYVFDVAALTKSDETEKDKWTRKRAFDYYHNCVEALGQHSSHAKVFVLLHKVDLYPEGPERDEAIADATKLVMEHNVDGIEVSFYSTSIWQSSLYDAWNTVIQHLVPNREIIAANVVGIRKACTAAHAAVFDRNTLLCICNTSDESFPPLSMTATSNRLKRLKVALSREMGNGVFWTSLDLRTNDSVAVIAPFTANTFIVVIRPMFTSSAAEEGDEDEITPALLRANVEYAADKFRKFVEANPQLQSTKEIL